MVVAPMNDIIELIKQYTLTDASGDPVIAETKKQIFCQVASVGMSEYYQANASGLKPEIKFILADYYDYSGEKEIDYQGTRYHVLRTYRTGNRLEITCYTEVNA